MTMVVAGGADYTAPLGRLQLIVAMLPVVALFVLPAMVPGGWWFSQYRPKRNNAPVDPP